MDAIETLKEQIDELIEDGLINLKSSDKDLFIAYTTAYFYELEDAGFNGEDAEELSSMLEKAFTEYKKGL